MNSFSRLRVTCAILLAGVLFAGCSLHGGAVPSSAFDALSADRAASPSVKTLYTFNGSDGSDPQSPMVVDSSGNIFGSAYSGGAYGAGLAFELVKGSSGYTESVLYNFGQGSPGSNPGPLTIDSSGNLWGESSAGVVELTPAKPRWHAKLVYSGCPGSASENNDTRVTPIGKDVFAACSVTAIVVKLSPSASGYQSTILHKFPNNENEEVYPVGGLIVDSSRHVFGDGWSYVGNCCGGGGPTYQLTPSGNPEGFRALFWEPTSYGLTISGDKIFETGFYPGAQGWGHIWEAVPRSKGYHVWSIFDHVYQGRGAPVIDASGDLYYSDGNTVVKLVPAQPKYRGRVIATVSSQAQPPWSDSSGNIYGATTADGGSGTIFQVVTK